MPLSVSLFDLDTRLVRLEDLADRDHRRTENCGRAAPLDSADVRRQRTIEVGFDLYYAAIFGNVLMFFVGFAAALVLRRLKPLASDLSIWKT